jgi:hypothetical protein
MTTTTSRPSRCWGTTYLRSATAEILDGLDSLGITPRQVRVDLWADGEPCEMDVWFGSYDDAWAYAQLLGLPPITHLNGGSDSGLIWFGCSSWETVRPEIAGARVGCRLVATAQRTAS